MAWSDEFISTLGYTSLSVEYKLEFLRVGNSVGRRALILSSGNAPLKIANGSVSISGTRVIPQRWSVSFGQFSLSLVGDIRMITNQVRKGQLAQLWCRSTSTRRPRRSAHGRRSAGRTSGRSTLSG